MFQVYQEIYWIHQEFSNVILQVYFEPVFETHLYFFFGSEVYLKEFFKIYWFVVKLKSILEVDFLNLQIYIQS